MDTNPSYHKARHSLALALMDIGAVLTADSVHPLVVVRGEERGFKLKLHEKNTNAPLSPFYLNLRTSDNKSGPLTSESIGLAARCMWDIQFERKLTFDAIVGVPRAGNPFATALGQLTGKPVIELEKYEHGGKRSIESLTGLVSESVKKVVLVDDLITGADSKIEAIQVLRDVDLEVTDVVVLVDREQGGGEGLSEWSCNLHSVFTITELLDLYVEVGRMQQKLRDDIQTYLKLAA